MKVRHPPKGLFASPRCLECGLCCRETEMILLREDVERLEGAGFRREQFAVRRGGFLRLRNVGGRCVFYDEGSGRCSVYELRPLGCRLYPLVFDEALGVVFDAECPLSAEFSGRCEEVEEACELMAELLRRLREEYGYAYDEVLFAKSSRRLLSSCRKSLEERGESNTVAPSSGLGSAGCASSLSYRSL